MARRKRTRVVVNADAIPNVVQRMSGVNLQAPIEVRERRDGGWQVWYPDESWTPLPGNEDATQRYVSSFWPPCSLPEAKRYAATLAAGYATDRSVVQIPL